MSESCILATNTDRQKNSFRELVEAILFAFCGCTFLIAAASKLGSTHFTFIIQHDLLYGLSIVLDILLAVLIVIWRTRGAFKIAALLTFGYLVFRSFSSTKYCNCFGDYARIPSQALTIFLVFTLVLCMVNAFWISRDVVTSNGAKVRDGIAILFLFFLILSISASVPVLRPATVVARSVGKFVQTPDGKLVGKLEIRNTSESGVQILGFKPSCSGSLNLNRPVEISAGCYTRIEAVLSGNRTRDIGTGVLKLFIRPDGDKIQSNDMPWVVQVDTKE